MGARYEQLAPSWDLIHTKDPILYKKKYKEEVLSKLDPKQVASDLEGESFYATKKAARIATEG